MHTSQALFGVLLSALILADGLELSASISRVGDDVVVVARARNGSEQEITFCGLWRFELDYTLNDDGLDARNERNRAREERRVAAAERGAPLHERCGPHLIPTMFDVSGLGTPRHPARPQVTLAPSESLDRELAIPVPRGFYARWPGTLTVRLSLDLCDSLDAALESVPYNGAGGRLELSWPVP